MSLDQSLFLAYAGFGLTLMLWGVDKMLDAAEQGLAEYQGRWQRFRRALRWLLLKMTFIAGLLFFYFGLKITLLLLWGIQIPP